MIENNIVKLPFTYFTSISNELYISSGSEANSYQSRVTSYQNIKVLVGVGDTYQTRNIVYNETSNSN